MKTKRKEVDKIKVLSLFDGMSCGMLAFNKADVLVDRYVAYEIDKYAIQTSQHNFPSIEHKGDVFNADFSEYIGFDYLIGGSPCTYWSIAQTKNRETTASGLGWELFSQYIRALKQAKPKYFIYENNKSMSKEIRKSISETFGFEPIMIDSALVSAQSRKRLYWVGKLNADGIYSKVDVKLPEDKHIITRDILDSGCDLLGRDKAFCLTARYSGATDWNTKAQTIKAQYKSVNHSNICCYKSTYGASGVAEPVRVGCMPSLNGELKNSQGMRIYSIEGKSVNQTAQGGGLGAKTGLYAIPCTTRQTDKTRTLTASYSNSSQRDFIRDIETNGQLGKTGVIECFTTPIEWNEQGEPIKAISGIDGKTYTVFKVENEQITIKGKQYPIKLEDGFYIIRKFTIKECMRLQTVPETYEFPVSNTQAYKMLGNGWTVDVITHLIQATQEA